MTSSTSSSTSRGLAALLLAAAACATPQPTPPPWAVPPRLVVLPATNASGTPVPVGAVTEELERALEATGVEVIGGARVREWLAQHRIRHLAGVDAATAQAARQALGAEAVVVSVVEAYGAAEPPRFGASMRLVDASESVRLRWTDTRVRGGDDEPGLLGTGVVTALAPLRARVLGELVSSLGEFLSTERERWGGACRAESRFRPRVTFRSPTLEPAGTAVVAVLPFLNETARSEAAEVVAGHLVRQLHATGALHVMEPGRVRENLLGSRIIMEGGVSLETARLVLGSMGADLLVTGAVQRYEDGPGGTVARAAFTITVLDTHTRRIVWQSTSDDRGDEGLRLFDRGIVRAAPELVCRMARHVADGIARPVR